MTCIIIKDVAPDMDMEDFRKHATTTKNTVLLVHCDVRDMLEDQIRQWIPPTPEVRAAWEIRYKGHLVFGYWTEDAAWDHVKFLTDRGDDVLWLRQRGQE